MNRHYTITVYYFLLMLLMLLITGIWMLLLHTSLDLTAFTQYYVEKSFYGLLETVTPHLFAMGTIVFILTHFLALKNKNTSLESTLSNLLFISMISSNLSVFFITEVTSWLIWLKIISTILFLLLSFFLIWFVFKRKY